MPYRTKAELDRENWKTVPEAVEDICGADGCEVKAARDQLRKALSGGGLWPLRWQFEKRDRTPQRKSRDSAFAVPDDLPPSGQEWSEAKIRWTQGRVRDDWGDYNKGKWRVLLIHGLSVGRYWPQSPRPNVPQSGGPAGARVIPFARRKTGPQTGKLQSIMEAMKVDISSGRMTKDELDALADKELVLRYGKPFDSERTSSREARTRVLTEFDGNSNSVK
jgi:hypothetical protein